MITEKPARKTRSNYTIILVLLVVFTILEVATSYLQTSIKIPLLLTLAGVKACLVILYFMHLRHDSRLYGVFFLLGALLIFPFFLIMLLVMPGL
jgi:cytochrome c oxidase subunit IV